MVMWKVCLWGEDIFRNFLVSKLRPEITSVYISNTFIGEFGIRSTYNISVESG